MIKLIFFLIKVGCALLTAYCINKYFEPSKSWAILNGLLSWVVIDLITERKPQA
jgi:hypothetical protein